MQNDTNVKISPILQCQKYPKGYACDSKTFFTDGKQQKTHVAQPKTSQKMKN